MNLPLPFLLLSGLLSLAHATEPPPPRSQTPPALSPTSTIVPASTVTPAATSATQSTLGAAGALVPPCCRHAPASAPLTGDSIYQLASLWTSDRDRVVPLSQFRGRPVLLVLFFSRCEFACPILVHDLRRVEAALPEGVRAGIDVVLVSIDPENDTPAALRRFRERQQLPLDRWSLLRGSAGDVRELAAVLGVNYRRDDRGQYAHSNLITVLDPEGVVAFQENGLNRPVTELVHHLTRLLAGRDITSREPTLRSCAP